VIQMIMRENFLYLSLNIVSFTPHGSGTIIGLTYKFLFKTVGLQLIQKFMPIFLLFGLDVNKIMNHCTGPLALTHHINMTNSGIREMFSSHISSTDK
jgi:hypothetical protein